MIKTFKYIACCLVGVLALLPMQAQNIIRPKIAGPGNLWVNSYNGVLFFGQTDFETQNSAMPMQLRFYYNSSYSSVDYGYGLGFSMGYEMRYREDVIGGVDIESGDGRTDHFTKYGDEYKAPAGVFSILVRPTFDTYLLTTKDGMKYFFDSAHHRKVTAIEDRNGNRTTFKYQDTLLVEVKDAVGHTITFSYTDGLLTQASATFSPGKYKYEYDGLRRLRKRIDPMGNVTIYDYSRQNKLDEITDANGNKTLIAYNDAGMVSRMKTDVSDKSIRYDGDKTVFIDYTKPNNVYSYYRWDDKGRAIEKVGLCCGIQSTLKYDDDDNVAQRIDANGNMTHYTYDDHGNMLTLRDPLSYTEHYSYEPIFNQVASFCDKNGNTYSFSYDAKGNLTDLNGPLGLSYRYTYDNHGWRTMSTDPNGGVTRTTYNIDGTTAKIENPDGGTINYTYDSYGRMTSVIDALGNTTSYSYDNLDRVTQQIDALGNTTTVTYDKVGNIVRVLDVAGNITAYSYDALGHVTSITDAMGGVYLYEYDGRGNVISIVDPLGIKQQYTYNDHNKIESYINGEIEKSYYDYDVKGNLISEMLPNGNVVSYEYNELDRLIEISDNMGLIAIYEYDANGNLLTETDGLDRTMTYNYDALNRIISEVLPAGSTSRYSYDNNSNLLSVTDAIGNVTSFAYNSLNQPISHTDALSAKTQFEYNANGNLTKVIDAKGNVTSFAYDALSQNTAITFANGLSLQYTYDELGRVITLKDRAGREFNYTYNPLGRVLTKTYPDGTSDNYTYDGIGRMLSAINKDASVSFIYDRVGRLLRETLNGKVTGYNYDVAAGKRTLTYPSGMKVVEQFNARELITSITQNGIEVATMNYNAAGQKISQGYANGISTTYGYNQNGWISSLVADHDMMNLKMTYDPIGNMTERKDILNENRNETYGYDAISQLVSFKRGTSVDKSYQFDLLGNLIKVLENGAATFYTVNNVNAYTRITGELNLTPQYDINGNMINDNKHLYAYDMNNREVIVDDNNIYKYDALGRRFFKNGINCYYADDCIIEEQSNNVTTSYILGNNIDETLLMNRNDFTYYYHSNHLGSTMFLSDNNGNVVEKIEYDTYGNPVFYDGSDNLLMTSTIKNDRLFNGREYDYETGLYFYRSRSHQPVIGRFMQKDPLMYVNGLNDYTYAQNNPIIFTDPNGTVVPLVVWGGILLAANIGAWSTYYKNGTFSPSNTSWQKAGYGALKGAAIAGASAYNPAVGVGVAANFGAWETYYDDECGTFSPTNTTPGKVLFNAGVAGGSSYIGGRIGGSNDYGLAQKLGLGFINDFYSDYAASIGNQLMDGKQIDWSGNATNAFFNAGTGAFSATGEAFMNYHQSSSSNSSTGRMTSPSNKSVGQTLRNQANSQYRTQRTQYRNNPRVYNTRHYRR